MNNFLIRKNPVKTVKLQILDSATLIKSNSYGRQTLGKRAQGKKHALKSYG